MDKKIKEVFLSKNINLIFVADKSEACEKILNIIPENASIGYGGSATLTEIGILDKIRNGNYKLYDRSKVEKYTPEFNELNHNAQHADYFLAGSNAITRDGKIVNKDRTGNRVSSLIFGPKKVIIAVGKNKLVDNLEAALKRIETVAAPRNAKKIGVNTPCVKLGYCVDCNSPERLCCNTVIIERQVKPDRMTVVLIDEDLGF
ncbi:MAG: lactate utilization protein [bacterium]